MESGDILRAERLCPDTLSTLARPLLDWYDAHRRPLPWRDNPTPYRVWVSEIMLQQTRVEAVRGYFTRFIARLPDPPALARVEEDKLLKLWEGLGYYNRARNLQKAAKVILREYGGSLPASYGALLELPGIGEYTAGAIASIAFGIPVPAVDGNVLRVLSRLTAAYADISLPQVKRAWRDVVPLMQPPGRPGDFNQALMELGALTCLPGALPRCGDCPVQTHCCAFGLGCASELPVKAARKPRRVEDRTVILAVAERKLLLFQRGVGLLAGMYEPLNLPGHLTPPQAAQAVAALGGDKSRPMPLGPSRHLFTHIEWRMAGYRIDCAPFPPPAGAVWADAGSLSGRFALPSAFGAYMQSLTL